MTRIKKTITFLVFTFLFALFWGLFFADFFIHQLIEKTIQDVSQTSTRVEKVSSSLVKGKLEVHNLSIENPPSFSSEKAIQLELFSVDLDPLTLIHKKWHIENLLIKGLKVRYEGNLSKGKSNLEQLASQAKKAQKTLAQSPSSALVAKELSKTGKAFQVHHLKLQNCQIILHIAQLGPTQLKVSIPQIELHDLGNSPQGITAQEIAEELASILTKRVVQELKEDFNLLQEGPGQLLDIQQTGKKVGKSLEKTLQGLFEFID